MTSITDKLNLLINLIGKREPEEIDNLRSGLTRKEIQQKTAKLPFDFPEELYELYQWRNGVENNSIEESPFLFRDHHLSNLEDAIKNYFSMQQWFKSEEDQKIADWSTCFPFADFEGSYLLFFAGNHILMDKYQHPIINNFEGINLYFYSFDSMLDTCIEWNQQSFEKYEVPDKEQEIWEKHNPGIFNIDLLHM